MTKATVYFISIIGLVLFNLILVGILVTKPNTKQNQEIETIQNPKMVVIERLKFDENQIKQYVKLIDTHNIVIKEKDAEIARTKQQLYKLLSGNLMINKADSLTSVIGEIQKEIEMLHFDHFKDIKKLCNEKQQIKFEQLSIEISKIFERELPPQ
ncbi:hypothetical protein ULMS_10710 [Patiriisocius marinistellae]|uniref:Uncharacterized protein n=1 Tax=Patiriisocius marinistellae TaxID=2494560 RepID=A0A5J4FUQ0_9FLAO|nr:hypothetical protein [Patiriisocius marinistellae]GEQ85563.1 hypothetical protein ULMS_10710 [Patiriisocius marinistellae]